MAKAQTTYQIRAKVSRAGHILLDERLDEARFEYNATLEDRRSAYRLLGVSIRTRGAGMVQNREIANRPVSELQDLKNTLAELEAENADTRKIKEARRAVNGWLRNWRSNQIKARWPSLLDIEAENANYYDGSRSESRRLINAGRILTETRDKDSLPRRVRVEIVARADRAFDAFFKRVQRGETPGYPRFKGKARFRTIALNSSAEKYLSYNPESHKGMVRIKGFPTLRFKSKRELPVDEDGKVVQPSQISITRKRAGVYLSLSYPIDVKPEREGMPYAPIGIDRGVSALMAFSDRRKSVEGEKEHAKARRRRKRKAQRKINRAGVAKDGKGGESITCGDGVRRKRNRGNGEYIYYTNGRRKAVEQLGRISERDTLRHRQRLHRYTSEIVKSSDFIAVEDLNIANMTKSAAGDADNPGKGVSAKRGLNRAILEQGWGYIATMLEYKAERAGIPFMRVEPAYTSQTCPACGVIDAHSRRERRFDCVSCDYENDADVNGAINILSRALIERFGRAEAQPLIERLIQRDVDDLFVPNLSSALGSGKNGLLNGDNPARRKPTTGRLPEYRRSAKGLPRGQLRLL